MYMWHLLGQSDALDNVQDIFGELKGSNDVVNPAKLSALKIYQMKISAIIVA